MEVIVSSSDILHIFENGFSILFKDLAQHSYLVCVLAIHKHTCVCQSFFPLMGFYLEKMNSLFFLVFFSGARYSGRDAVRPYGWNSVATQTDRNETVALVTFCDTVSDEDTAEMSHSRLCFMCLAYPVH